MRGMIRTPDIVVVDTWDFFFINIYIYIFINVCNEFVCQLLLRKRAGLSDQSFKSDFLFQIFLYMVGFLKCCRSTKNYRECHDIL